MQRTAIVGDVHGDAARLRRALDAVGSDDRRLVFVGDYVNRGPQSREVLDLLAGVHADRPRGTVLLRGNHEAALLQWLVDGDHRSFLQHGGLVTVRQYLPDAVGAAMEAFPRAFPRRHLDVLASTLPYLEEEGLFVSHAGFDPSQPAARDWHTMTLGGRGTRGALFAQPHDRPRALTVFGHYVQHGRTPYDKDGLVCLDTGCGTLADGPLSVLLLPEREFLQF